MGYARPRPFGSPAPSMSWGALTLSTFTALVPFAVVGGFFLYPTEYRQGSSVQYNRPRAEEVRIEKAPETVRVRRSVPLIPHSK